MPQPTTARPPTEPDTQLATGGGADDPIDPADDPADPSDQVDTGDEPAGAADVDACALLSEQEAGDVLGGPIVDVGPTFGVGDSVCMWEIEGNWSVTLSVGSPDTAAGNTFDPAMVLMLGNEEPVADLDHAYYVGLGTVAFAADDRLNTIQVVLPDSEGNRPAAEQLAALVSPRIASG